MNASLEEARAERFLRLYIENQHRLAGFVRCACSQLAGCRGITAGIAANSWRKFDEFDVASEFFSWAARVIQMKSLTIWKPENGSALS